ncbi:MAG: hypothetical protein FWG18_02890 [Alphaproteobacteria bacterium]|nr:hypothetical protein [Alphaproteobacteria bacterium]
MAMEKIMQGFKDIADNQALLHEEAMLAVHKINLHGLKRLHKIKSKKFFKLGLCVANDAFDYGMEVKKPMPKGGYTASSLKEHLTKMVSKLEADMNALKKLNYQFITEAGMEYEHGVKLQEKVTKVWMKMKFRWIPRFEFTKWSPEDIVEWDKWLHDKCRCMEEHKDHHHGCPHCHQHGHKIG